MKITKRELMAWLLITIGGITLRKSAGLTGFKEFVVIALGYILIFYVYVKLPRK